jgi:nucleoside-diphosphate-sugar epimerase
MTDRLIVGCGYLGSRVGQRWLAEGGRAQNGLAEGGHVHVVTRSRQRAANLKEQGYAPIVADVTDRASLARLPPVSTVLYAVGFDRAAGSSMRQVYVDGLAAVLDALPAGVRRLIYISSTSVYGQTDGSWIDEDSPTVPTRENGRICLEAERTLMAHRLGGQAIILRLARTAF